jgi:hypothetical protein
MQNKTPSGTTGTQAGPGDAAGESSSDTRHFLYVVRGEPTDTELAAVVTVLAARAGAAAASVQAPPREIRSAWSDRSRLIRESISPGPGAWRRSALPR